MREIIFRGIRVDTKEWTYGYLFKIWGKAYILWGTTNEIPNMIEVTLESIGQYTGVNDKKIGIISFKKPFPDYINTVLAPSGNLTEAARNLFKSLRWMGNQQVEIILTECVPDHGLGRAINDRLKRASSK